jgi:hypothetical protein
MLLVRSQPPEKRERVQFTQPQIEQHRVGAGRGYFSPRRGGIERRQDLVAFQPQHARERLENARVVVDDQHHGQGFAHTS